MMGINEKRFRMGLGVFIMTDFEGTDFESICEENIM